MKKKFFHIKFYLLIFISATTFIYCCQDGCQSCQTDSITSNYICSKCMDGYTQQGDTCIPNICEAYQFQSNGSGQQNQCISLCDNNTIGVSGSNICQQSNNCSKRYSQSSFISKGRDVQEVQPYLQGNLIAIYSNFFNVIDSNSGSFLRTYNFISKIILIKSANSNIYLFSSENEIYLWNREQNQITFVTVAQKGIINSKSEVVSVSNNLNRLFLTSFFDQDQQVILSEIKQNTVNQIVLQYDTSVVVMRDLIIFQNASNQIQLINLQEDSNQNVNINKITPIYLCDSIQGSINQVEYSDPLKMYFLTFKDTNGIQVITSPFTLCKNTGESVIPLKIQLFQLKPVQQNQLKSFLMTSFSTNEFKIYDPQSLLVIAQVTIDSQIIDFISLLQNDNVGKVYILKQNNQIDIYIMTYDLQTNVVAFHKINTLQALINNPKRLLSINKSDPLLPPQQLCVVGKDVQVIQLLQEITAGVAVDYKEKAYYNEGKIKKLFYAEEINITLSCSEDGKLVAWNFIEPLRPIFYYNIVRKDQNCIDVLVFQSKLAVSLFSKEIIIFNIFNSNIYQSISVNPNFYSGIQVSSDYIFLFYNQQTQVMKDMNQIVLTSPMGESAKNVFYSKAADIYILDQSDRIVVYSFDSNLITIKLKSTVDAYQFSIPVIASSLFNQDSGDVYIMITDSKSQFTILNDQLKNAYPTFQLDGSTLFLYQYSTSMYFIMLYAPNKNKSYPFAFECIELTTSVAVLNIHQVLNCNQLVYIKKQLNNPPSSDYFYYLTAIVPMSYTSIMIEVIWNKSTQTSVLEKFLYSPNYELSKVIPNPSKSLILCGSNSGFVGVVPYNKQYSMKKYFTLPTYSSGDQINQIKFNFKLGIFFVISRKDVYCFNAFTNKQIEKISLINLNGDSDIIDIKISEQQKIFVFYSKNQIFLKNTKLNNLYNLDLTTTPTIQSLIYGCYIDDTFNRIFVYGDSLVSYDINLANPIKYSSPSQINYEQCIFFKKIAMCKMNVNNIQFFNREVSFVLIQNLRITSMTNFKIVGDEDYQYLYVYDLYIEVYTFAGVYKQSFTDMTMNIFQFQLSGAYFVAYTSASAFIISRQDLVLKGTFVPSGASLIQGFYFKEINMIAYLTNEIRYGQIKFFSLDSFQAMGSLTNQFTLNKVGKAKKVVYDPDNSMINYIDQYGNEQNANYGQQINTDSMIAVPEMQREQTGEPNDYILDFDLNDIFITNYESVWRMNYNVLIKIFQRTIGNPKNQYVMMNQQNDATTNNASLVYADNYNNIFSYQNYKINFLVKLNEDIQEIRTVYQQNTRFTLIILPQKVIYYKGESVDFSNQQNSNAIENTRVKQFLTCINDFVVFQTVENSIIDFDFVNEKQLQSFSFSQNSILVAYKEHISLTDKTKQFLYFSTNTGFVYKYDLVSKSYQSYPLFQNTDVVMDFIILNSPNIALLLKSGLIVEVDSSTFSILPNQNLNTVATNFQAIAVEIKTQYIPFLQYDLANNIYYLSIAEEKKLGVFKISDNSLITTLAFPQGYWKIFKVTNKYVILACTYQLNFYDKEFNFIGRFRRSIKKSSISQIIDIFDDYFFIVQVVQIETIYVNSQKQQIQLIDSIALTEPKITHFQLIDNQTTLKIIGISKLGVFEERLSVGLFQQQSQSSSPSNILSCSAEVSYLNTIQIQNDFENIYTPQDRQQRNFFLSIMINNEIQQMDFLQKGNVQFILRPQNPINKILNLREKSFYSITSNVFMSSFDLQFVEQGKVINFQLTTKNVTIQDVNILNQDLQLGTRINLQDKNIVQITNMNIKNIQLLKNQQASTLLIESDLSLFYFSNVQYLLIEQLTIENLSQIENNFLFLHADNIGQLIIKKLTILNSKFSNDFIRLNSITKLRIMDISIFNCQRITSNQRLLVKQNLNPIYFMTLNGVQIIEIHNFKAENNIGIQFIKSSKAYTMNDFVLILKNDTFVMQNSQFINNQYPDQFTIDLQINLMDLSTTTVSLQQVKVQSNSGNIFIQNINQAQIDSCLFSNNQGVQGASLQFENIVVKVDIQNSQFVSNNAQANGGAIYSLNVKDLQIDSKSTFEKNNALIGGAIRILINRLDLESSLNIFSSIQSQFQQNSATIYGQDIASYPTQFIVTQTLKEDTNQQITLYQGQLSDQTTDIIKIQDLQSGGNTYLNIQLLDNRGQVVYIDQKKVQSNDYPQSIKDELSTYQFEIYSNPSDKSIEVKGESLITIKQYDSSNSRFGFKNLVLSATPNSKIISTQLHIQINSWHPSFKISFQQEFRECVRGEISVQTSPTITLCRECTTGTYSLEKSIAANTSQDSQQLSSSCKKCPQGASKCEKDVIILKQGYWREDNDTDTIIQCNTVRPEICASESEVNKFGCIEGHIGPLCESCDTFGDTWKGDQYSFSFQNYTCNKCSEQTLQFLQIILLFLAVFLYLYWGIIMFMNNYVYNARCSYIRIMAMLPFSKSCILDESTFIIKSLINYLQIAQVLYNTSMNFIPQALTFIPSMAGQPMGKIIVSSSCIYNKIRNFFGLDQEIKIRSTIYIAIPFLFLLLLYIILKIQMRLKMFKINKYHFYMLVTILFFFFQPDTIQFLTSTLTCRQIGDKRYVRTSLILSCDNQSYFFFQYYAVLPTLTFWIIFPLIILIKFIRDTKKSQNLHFCINKFKFGYFYLEYKHKYFYWEFIRVYIRIIIVLAATLLIQLDFIAQVLCILIVAFYSSALHIYDPFQSNMLGKLEILSNFILILNTFLTIVLSKYNHVSIEIFISIFHNGLIFLFLSIAIKMKLNSNNKIQDNKYLRCVLNKCIPKAIAQRIIKSQQSKLKTLFNWKKVYYNLVNIRQQRVEEQMSKIKSSVKQAQDFSIIQDQTQRNNMRSKFSSTFKLHQGLHSPNQQPTATVNTTEVELFASQQQSPFLSCKEKKHKIGNENFKLLAFPKDTKSNSVNSHRQRQESIEEGRISTLLYGEQFPVIDIVDFEEQSTPNIMYKSKQSNNQNKQFEN